MVKCVLQSLASKYREAVAQLNRCLPSPIHRLNIIGGGSQNKLLNQLTANALGIPVYAGPEYPDSGNGERRNIQPPGNQRNSKPQCYTTSILP
jgi:sugar (pentulose or hexulose) kinase